MTRGIVSDSRRGRVKKARINSQMFLVLVLETELKMAAPCIYYNIM